MAQAPKFVAFFAAQAIVAVTIINPDLPDPAMNGSGAGFILPRKALDTAPGSRQRNQLIPEFRRAVEVTSSNIGDAPMLPALLAQIPPDQEIGSVTADGAYDTRKCHDAIAARNASPVIPPCKNARFWKPDTPGARARNEAVRSSKYLGRAL